MVLVILAIAYCGAAVAGLGGGFGGGGEQLRYWHDCSKQFFHHESQSDTLPLNPKL